MEKFGTLLTYISEKTIAILGDRWWPQTVKQEGDKMDRKIHVYLYFKRDERPNVGGVSIRTRSGAPSRKVCVINGRMTTASDK